MSDKTKNDEPAAAKPTTATTNVAAVMEDEAAKVIGDETAKFLWGYLPADVKAKLHQHPQLVTTLLALRFIPGLPKLVGEGVSDFVGTLRKIAKAGPDTQAQANAPTHTTTPVTPAQQQTVAAVSVIIAIDGLDQADRDDFMEWYLEGNNAEGFNRLVVGQDIAAIQKTAVMSKPNLERLIANHTAKIPMTLTDLRMQIAADADLNEQTEIFLQTINAAGRDRTREFWAAIGKHIKSIGEFKSLMTKTDLAIFDHLQMPRETVKKRFDNVVAAIDKNLGRGQTETGVVKWSGDFLASAKKAAKIK